MSLQVGVDRHLLGRYAALLSQVAPDEDGRCLPLVEHLFRVVAHACVVGNHVGVADVDRLWQES
jgi:hypothetical protein